MTSQEMLAQLWCEPLHQLDPSWLAHGDQCWLDSVSGSPVAARLAHRLACHRLGLTVESVPALRDAHSASLIEALPMSGSGLTAAARFTAMAAFAAQDGFAVAWQSRSRTLLQAAPAAGWRAAVAASRARRLSVTPGSLMVAGCRDEFTAHGLKLLAAACEALLPGLWLRLRLRCPRHLVDPDGLPTASPGLTPAFLAARLQVDAAACKQVMRLCAAAPTDC